MSVCIGEENKAHLVQSNKPMYKQMSFYFLSWVQFFYDFGKVIPSGTTQGYFCPNRWIMTFIIFFYFSLLF
jgi:hypothetical protein